MWKSNTVSPEKAVLTEKPGGGSILLWGCLSSALPYNCVDFPFLSSFYRCFNFVCKEIKYSFKCKGIWHKIMLFLLVLSTLNIVKLNIIYIRRYIIFSNDDHIWSFLNRLMFNFRWQEKHKFCALKMHDIMDIIPQCKGFFLNSLSIQCFI